MQRYDLTKRAKYDTFAVSGNEWDFEAPPEFSIESEELIMRVFSIALVAAALTIGLTGASIAGSYETEVKAYGMSAPDDVVEGAQAVMVSSEAGVAGIFTTSNLVPGHVYTMWVAIINKPEACELKDVDHCTPGDVVGRSDVVESDVTLGDGMVASADGTATFRTFIPTGDVGRSWIGNGLTNPMGAEIHFALHDHGPEIDGKIAEMLTTAREGCIEDSLPGGWPASARAWGEAGPNQCAMAQFAILKQ